jgi:hypothetical protein
MRNAPQASTQEREEGVTLALSCTPEMDQGLSLLSVRIGR